MLANKKLYEVENARQTGKVANFGFPGGLGAEKLCLFARKTYGVIISIEEARNLKQVWLTAYPEMIEFFNFINEAKSAPIVQLFSNRLRGNCTFCQACNTVFQGLGADASQNAGWMICKACYVDKFSPLYGARPVLYVHDEYVLEAREDEHMHEAA